MSRPSVGNTTGAEAPPVDAVCIEDTMLVPLSFVRCWLHEVRQPLNVISLAAFNLQREVETADPAWRARLDRVRSGVAALGQMTRNLDSITSGQADGTAAGLAWFARALGYPVIEGDPLPESAGTNAHRFAIRLLSMFGKSSCRPNISLRIDAAAVRIQAGSAGDVELFRRVAGNQELQRLAARCAAVVELEPDHCFVVRADVGEIDHGSS